MGLAKSKMNSMLALITNSPTKAASPSRMSRRCVAADQADIVLAAASGISPRMKGPVNCAVDHDVGHMNSFRTQFPGETLPPAPGARALRPQGQQKTEPPRTLAVAPVKRMGAAAAFDHAPRGLAAREDPSRRGHLPNLGMNPRGRLDDQETHIRRRCKGRHLEIQARSRARSVQEGYDIVFDPGIESERA